MALRQLAGPFDVKDVDGNALVGWAYPMWYPQVGLVCRGTSAGKTSFGILSLDGVFAHINGTQNLGSFTAVGYWLAEKKALSYVLGAGEYAKTMMGLFPYLIDNIDCRDLTWWNGSYVRLTDRRIYFGDWFGGAVVWQVPNGGGWGSSVIECNVPNIGGVVFAGREIGAGKTYSDVLLVEHTESDTALYLYDPIKKEVISPRRRLGMPCSYLLGCPDFGILISLHSSPFQVRIWSFESIPTQISVPSLLSGGKKGEVAVFRSQVTADGGDPCEGELVDWSLTGPGTLLDEQSRTDANGYALARVLYSLSAVGDSTLEASLVC